MVKNIRRPEKITLALGVLAVSMLLRTPDAAGKVRYATLVEKTRQSELVLTGTVVELRGSNLLVNAGKISKGTPAGNPIEIEMPSEGNVEMPLVQYKAGDAVLIFANKKGSLYAPFMGQQGVLKLESGWPAEYEAAIKGIADYDVATSTAQKRVLLRSMLRGNNRLLHHAALWDFIYLDPNTRKKGIANDDLLPTFEGLAKGPDGSIAGLATQVIGKMRGPKAIPVLIDLVGNGHAMSAEAASRILSRKNKRDKTVDAKQSSDERKKARDDWKAWWEENKDKVKLRE